MSNLLTAYLCIPPPDVQPDNPTCQSLSDFSPVVPISCQNSTHSSLSDSNSRDPISFEHVPPSTNTHPVTTRLKNVIVKPNPKYDLNSIIGTDIEPQTVSQELKDPRWVQAMHAKFEALIHNNTWVLVPPDLRQNLVRSKRVFRIKCNPNGSIDRFKARLVARDFHQCPSIDFLDTFSSIVKLVIVWVVLSIALRRLSLICQLDVNNVFLNGHLIKEVYNKGIIVSQHKYIVDLCSGYNMLDSKPISMPLVVGSPLSAQYGAPLVNTTLYC